MVLQMLEKSMEYLSVLLNEKVFKDVVLLLEKQLLHNLVKVAAQDWVGIVIGVKERGQVIKE